MLLKLNKKGCTVWLILSIILLSLSNLFKSYCLGSAFDLLNNFSDISFYIFLIAGSVLFSIAAGLFFKRMSILSKTNIQLQLNERFIKSCLARLPEQFQSKDSSHYVSQASTEINGILDQYAQPVISCGSLIISFVCGSIFIASFSWIMLLFLYTSGALLYVINRVFKPKIEQNQKTLLKAREKWIQAIQNFCSSFSVIRNYGIESKFDQWLQNSSESLCRTSRKSQSLIARLSVFNNGFADFCFLALILFGMLLIHQDQMNLAQFMMVLQSSNYILSPIVDIHDKINEVRSGRIIFDKFIQETEMPAEEEKESLDQELKLLEANISGFGFDGRTILKNVHLRFESGKKYLFLGPSGCGKSTLMKIIGSQIHTDFITINGMNASDLSFNSVTEKIGYMDQYSSLLPWTLKQNITLQKREDPHQLKYLLEQMNLNQVFALHGDEIDPPLSGGELQRTVLARLLYQNKKWLILDEPFSALDETNTLAISKMLLENPELTIISVEHKPVDEMLPLYDHIYQVRDGAVFDLKTSCQTDLSS